MRFAERCAAQRHFLGYDADDGEGEGEGGGDAMGGTGGRRRGANLANPYLLRQLMGFCMFHGCQEGGLLGEANLTAHGVAPAASAGGPMLFE